MKKQLFETLCTIDHLMKAWLDVKSKKAGGGIDGESIATFEINLQNNLAKIRDELLSGTWEPEPYLRIEIPKKKTEKRQIGMLTVKDKVVQQAIRLLLEPRCEMLFMPCSYGYRPNKGAVAAIKKVMELFRAQVVDRVVISLIQKKEPLEINDGLLSNDTKKLLAANITERLQKREKYRGEEMSLDKIIGRQASAIATYFTENERYLPYKAKW